MNRVNFGAKIGVIVSRCRDHGVWLDGGELMHLFEWMKAGGKLLEKERDKQALAQQEREEQNRKRLAPGNTDQTYPAYDRFTSYGSTLRDEDPDLFEIVRDAIRFFTR